jgi:hypothetical protein
MQFQDIFIQEITINFLKREKNSKQPFVKGIFAFNVFSKTQAGLKQKADGNFAIRKKGNEAKGIGYIQMYINTLLKESPTEIKIINWVYGKIYSNTNQVQINRVRMRNEEAFLLDDEDQPEWDTGNGKCVYNAIINAYGKSKGLIKKMNEDYLTEVFKKYDTENENQNPLTDGVNLEQILGFCSEENISCYAFDIRDNLISKHLYDKSKGSNDKHKALVFRMYNQHIYPLTDDKKRKSLIERQKEDHKHSNIIVSPEKKEDKESKEHEESETPEEEKKEHKEKKELDETTPNAGKKIPVAAIAKVGK